MAYLVKGATIGKLFTVAPALCNAFDFDGPAFAAEFSLTALHNVKADLPASRYTPVSKFPAFEFDFAVIVNQQIRAKELLTTITRQAGPLLDDIGVFDVFEHESLGKNKKSIAFRLSFIDKNKTLTINDIEPIIDKVVNTLNKNFSAKLRS